MLVVERTGRLGVLFDGGDQVQVDRTWGAYQPTTTANRWPDVAVGREPKVKLTVLSMHRVLAAITPLGRSFEQRAEDVLDCLERPGTSNGWPKP